MESNKLSKPKEFKVNEYLSLKLEDSSTNIYVKGELFQQCKFLLLNIPVDEIMSFEDIDSIDEAIEKLDRSLEGRSKDLVIPPETEFWGHCSNLQVWYENHYDTRILHSNLAFPLLKRLVEAGDVRAKRVFREEIVSRYIKGNETVQNYLMEEKFLTVLEDEELRQLVIELIERENIYGLDLLGLNMRHRIKFKADEVIDLIFDSNYDIKNWVNNFLKEHPYTGIFIIRLLLPLYRTNLPLYKKGFKKCFFYADKIRKLDFINISTLQIFDAEQREKFFNVLDFEVINNYPSEEALRKLSVLASFGSADAKQLLKDNIKKFFNDRNGNMIRFIIDRDYLKYLEPNELDLLFENFDYTVITEHEPEDLNYDESSTRLENLTKFGISKARLILKEEFFKKFKEDQLKGLELLSRYLNDLKTDELEDLLKDLDYNAILNQRDPHTFGTLSWLEKLGISKARRLFKQLYGPRSLVELFSSMNKSKEEIIYERGLKVIRSILPPSEYAFLLELQTLIDEKIQFYIDPRISNSPSIVIKQRRISQIWMVGQNIKELPKSIGALDTLKILNLNYNQLKTLPEEIGEPLFLEKLLVKNNNITTLPETIGALTRLRHLNFTRNELDLLPCSITELKRLKLLNLNFNNLQNLPNKFGDLMSLEKIFCDYNQLQNLPDTFHKLRNLERIDLQGNKLKTISRALLSLNSIKLISLSKEYLDRETINLIEPIKSDYTKFMEKSERDHPIGGLTSKRSLVKPLNILFGPYILRFFYEYGGYNPIIFWAANDEAKSKYGSPVRLDRLPLSYDVIEKFTSLYISWNIFSTNANEVEPKEFKNETRDIYLKAIKQLGPNFQVKFQMEGYGLPYER